MLSLLDSEVITIAVKGLWITALLYSEKSLNCLPLCTLTVRWTKNVIFKLIIIIVIVM